jgi:hypothetical protein
MTSPLGLNLEQSISPLWPSNSIIGDNREDVLRGLFPCTLLKYNEPKIPLAFDSPLTIIEASNSKIT